MPIGDLSFDNTFDLTSRNLSEIYIKETFDKDKCLIWDAKDPNKAYNSFILSKNSQSRIICDISFYKSSETDKYLPRPTFKRVALSGDISKTRSKDKVSVNFSHSEDAIKFWQLIGFLSFYKDLVDIGEFDKEYKVIPKDSYIIEFKDKDELQKIGDLKELIGLSDLNYDQLKELTFENRKKNLRVFFFLLQDLKNSRNAYRDKYNLNPGEENVWHYFLKNNDWIIGLNTDLKFIADLLDEQKVGNENSKGSESPIVDLFGISEFTTLIELKHSSTNIFKKSKSKGRANTWDFTSDFIEGVSQCLGQKGELEKTFETKVFLKDDKSRLEKDGIESIDPKSVLVIGDKRREFPTNKLDNDNILKNKTLERFRRNNRNIDIITFDELFERAYHIVYSKKLEKNWYWESEEKLFS
jgi:hypothetical protein